MKTVLTMDGVIFETIEGHKSEVVYTTGDLDMPVGCAQVELIAAGPWDKIIESMGSLGIVLDRSKMAAEVENIGHSTLAYAAQPNTYVVQVVSGQFVAVYAIHTHMYVVANSSYMFQHMRDWLNTFESIMEDGAYCKRFFSELVEANYALTSAANGVLDLDAVAQRIYAEYCEDPNNDYAMKTIFVAHMYVRTRGISQ